ncbi:hypothetical protein BDQ12DRAFT_217988 [Crucibulum laeve]|uniref:4Fe-4S ferredoxin-type domain-containing protein n=1 Tax=Crucibulum laeve TaxID=68775 RepID=A0A5C3LW13_9AGAR|nr:hypothetical protein BDQ12DRAFT_217988 [Crucibulum laeve]
MPAACMKGRILKLHCLLFVSPTVLVFLFLHTPSEMKLSLDFDCTAHAIIRTMEVGCVTCMISVRCTSCGTCYKGCPVTHPEQRVSIISNMNVFSSHHAAAASGDFAQQGQRVSPTSQTSISPCIWTPKIFQNHSIH